MSGSDSPTFFHGQPWSSWIERIGRDKPLSDDEGEAEPSTSVTRLSSDDIDLYGFCPERDTFYGVVCEICNAIIKPQALIQHMESRHSSGTVNLPPPPNPVIKPVVKTPYCKVSKLKRTQPSSQIQTGGKVNHTTSSTSSSASPATSSSSTSGAAVKRSAEQANLQSIATSLSSPRSPLESIPVQASPNSSAIPSSPVKSPGSSNSGSQPRRKRLKADRGLLKDREYDPDRHCGVWNDETGKPCTRSLTCKAHTVSLRRTVAGRSKTFDKLLADHRAAKEFPNRTPKVTLTGTVTVSSTAAAAAAAATSGLVNSFLAPSTPISVAAAAATDSDAAPGSPPVLSLPDTYPLPKAVDLLYRCLAPHGSTKPTKLEEDFVNEELRLETALANSSGVDATSKSMMAPISVVLPSLSPITSGSEAAAAAAAVATLIPATISPASVPVVVPTALPVSHSIPATVLEGETPVDVDTGEGITLYSPVSVYKDGKSQIVVQMPRAANSQSPRNYQAQASMPSLNLFESMDQIEEQQQEHQQQEQEQQQEQQQQQQQQQQEQQQQQLQPPQQQEQQEQQPQPQQQQEQQHEQLLQQQSEQQPPPPPPQQQQQQQQQAAPPPQQPQLQQPKQIANGKRLNNSHHSVLLSPVSRHAKRSKHDFRQEFSTSIQVEATTTTTTTSSPYPHFSDIAWSNCHPEPLAVSRWLRITSNRKQYNFNIH